MLPYRGQSTCSMYGYPGMDLVGDGGDMRLAVPRQAETTSPATISLRPGHHTSFTLAYLLETSQEIQGELGDWGPSKAVITSPNSTLHQTLKWPFGLVNRLSLTPGHGTYLSPVGD